MKFLDSVDWCLGSNLIATVWKTLVFKSFRFVLGFPIISCLCLAAVISFKNDLARTFLTFNYTLRRPILYFALVIVIDPRGRVSGLTRFKLMPTASLLVDAQYLVTL